MLVSRSVDVRDRLEFGVQGFGFCGSPDIKSDDMQGSEIKIEGSRFRHTCLWILLEKSHRNLKAITPEIHIRNPKP